MLGFVADDIGVSGGFGPSSKADIESYQGDARRIYGEQADTFLKLYPVAADADVIGARKAAGRDRARVSMDLWANEQLKASKRIYTYFFDRVIPWPAHPEFGAFHTSEVPYVFKTINRLDRPGSQSTTSLRRLSRRTGQTSEGPGIRTAPDSLPGLPTVRAATSPWSWGLAPAR